MIRFDFLASLAIVSMKVSRASRQLIDEISVVLSLHPLVYQISYLDL